METVEANGIGFACRTWGDAGEDPLLCLHGFPDDAGTFEPLADHLTGAGYRVVAPYMRGYGPTDPAPDGDYSGGALGRDALALAAELGADRLVGHDWGAVAAYAAMAMDPEAFDRLAVAAVPPNFVAELFDHPVQFLRSWYIWFFQFPGVAERAHRAREFALVDLLWSTWSPTWDYPRERVDEVKETLGTGDTVEHALAYYREMVNAGVDRVAAAGGPPDRTRFETPTLVLAGAEDGCIGDELFDRAGEAFETARVVKVRDAGHFLHWDRPEVVADELLGFL
jgi:pimeloyl-ACP methyl ester carboxylesterase